MYFESYSGKENSIIFFFLNIHISLNILCTLLNIVMRILHAMIEGTMSLILYFSLILCKHNVLKNPYKLPFIPAHESS